MVAGPVLMAADRVKKGSSDSHAKILASSTVINSGGELCFCMILTLSSIPVFPYVSLPSIHVLPMTSFLAYMSCLCLPS